MRSAPPSDARCRVRTCRRRLAYAAGAALEALPVPRRLLPLTRSRVRFMLQNRAYDGTRAREELGFVPTIESRRWSGADRRVVPRISGLL